MTTYDDIRVALHRYLVSIADPRKHQYALAHVSFAQGLTQWEAPRGQLNEETAQTIRQRIESILATYKGTMGA